MISQHIVERMARECRSGCGVECGDRPCDGCMAGGICDALPCRCEDSIDEPDDDFYDEDYRP